jgi:small-conductance mechanosensitive channel
LLVGLLLLTSLQSGPQAAGVESSEPDAEGPALPEHLTRQQVSELLAQLSDEDVRVLLMRQLEKVAVNQTAPETEELGFIRSFEDALQTAHDRLDIMVAAIPELPSLGTILFAHLTEGKSGAHLWTIAFSTIGFFAGGAFAEWGFRRLFTRIAEQPKESAAYTAVDKLCLLSLRLLSDVLALAVFASAAVGLFFIFYQGHEPTRELIAAVFWTVIVIRLASALGRFALAPKHPWLRLPPLDDGTAKKIYGRSVLFVGIIAGAVYLSDLYAAAGLEAGLFMLLGVILSFLALAAIVIVIWKDREAIGRLMLEETESGSQAPSSVREFLASNWHVFAITFITLIWLMSTGRRLLTGDAQAVPIITSLAVLVGIPIVDWIIRAILTHLLRVSTAPVNSNSFVAEARDSDGAAELGGEAARAFADAKRDFEKRLEYRDVLVRNLRLVLAVLCVVILAEVWDIDIQGVAARGVGGTLAGSLFDIVVTLILASAVWGIIRTAIRHAVADQEAGGEAAMKGDMGGKGGTRLQTLIPLLGNFVLITVALIVVMIALSELGVDIGPLIAGAGIVGIAVGFGAQTLVKDILSGLFFLIDDAFRVGEYINVGDVRGTVEHISIRSLRLRHHRGPVHTIPFGEIRHLTNYSRDWAIMKLELRVPFDTDLEKVRKIIKKVGQELLEHEEYGPKFLQPVKSQGVHRMDDSAFIIRVKFMAKPGEQFVLRRVVFSRIQEVFAENGIHFAPRRVVVETGDASQAAAGAAAAIARAEETSDGS